LGREDEALNGFKWSGGSDRVTTGLHMWGDVFLHDYPDGRKVAILLMDTQGTFDSQSTVKDCATVFALSTMLSSVQIYNLSQNIQEDDLQHLQLFTEYGRLAKADSGATPFQKLMLLVRDWPFPYEADYGLDGGAIILKKRLEIHEKQHPDHQLLRRHITSCFDEICCFLMPHPGLNVATNPKFTGKLSEISSEFKDNLLELIPILLAPENLIVKEINGQAVKARDLVQYFISYLNIFKSDDMPEPKTMLRATAEANNLNAVSTAKDLYIQHMEDFCGGKNPYQKPQQLDVEHQRAREKAVYHFVTKRKMGGDDISEEYKQQLIEFVEDTFIQYKQQNESKNIFKAAQTPGVFLVVALLAYIISGIFALFGMETFTNFMTLIMAISIIALCAWSYFK
jgi:atlastin